MPSRDFALYRTKVQMPTPLLRDRPWNFARVQCGTAELFTNVFFFFFSLEMWDFFKTQISQKIQNPNICRKKRKRRNPFRKRLGRGTFSKTAWTLDSEGIWGFMLEPARTPLNFQDIHSSGRKHAIRKTAILPNRSSVWIADNLERKLRFTATFLSRLPHQFDAFFNPKTPQKRTVRWLGDTQSIPL